MVICVMGQKREQTTSVQSLKTYLDNLFWPRIEDWSNMPFVVDTNKEAPGTEKKRFNLLQTCQMIMNISKKLKSINIVPSLLHY